jgi:Secretion system C-terminal sorting domain
LKFVNVTTGGSRTISNLPWSGSGYTYAATAGDTYQVFLESNCSAGNSGWVQYSSNITVEASARSLVTGQNNALTNALTDSSKFRIFPVPASGVVNLIHNADGNGNGDLSVINMVGSVLMVKPVGIAAGQNNYSLDVSKLPSGVYLIKLFNGKAVFLQKLVIQR